MSTQTKKQPNRLTDAQLFRLVQAVEADRAGFENLTVGEASKRLTKQLGFKVKPTNLRTIAEQFKFKFHPGSPSNGTNPVVEAHARCEFLERRVGELEKDRADLLARLARLEGLAGVANLTNGSHQ